MAFGSAGLPQREKSWYMLLFQFVGVAERWLTDDGWRNFREWSSHPDADAVIAELEANGSLTTPALSWYRANLPPSRSSSRRSSSAVQAPTMGIWSSGDMALTEDQMARSADFVSGPWRYERLDGPGHWMQLEAPDEVNRLLLDFRGPQARSFLVTIPSIDPLDPTGLRRRPRCPKSLKSAVSPPVMAECHPYE